MVVILSAQQEYVVGYATRYHAVHTDVEDVHSYALYQEGCAKDLKWLHQQLLEVAAIVIEYPG
jgi:hypothetical protein